MRSSGAPSALSAMMRGLHGLYRERLPVDHSRLFLETVDGRTCTYGELEDATAQFARFLVDLGIKKGDRVVSQVEKSPEAIFLYLGCLRAGAVYVPLSIGHPPAEVARLIAECEPRLIVCAPTVEATMRGIAEVQRVARVLTLDAQGRGSFVDGARSSAGGTTDAAVEKDDLALLIFTSGTSGEPKGVMLEHGHLRTKALMQQLSWGWREDDVLIHALPLFHLHGLFLALNGVLVSGARMLFLPRFDATTVVRMMPRATAFTGVPTMYARILVEATLTPETCRGMRLFLSTSSALSIELHEAFQTRTGHAILECYGLTETGTVASSPLFGDRRPGSVGLPLPDVDVRVVGEDGNSLLPGQTGVLEVRTKHGFRGYWRHPEDTALAFRPDGWFITGDLARIDDDGYLWIVGRAKDMVVTGGYNVYPREVEKAIEAVAGVDECAVVGVPHPDLGEAVIALVVPAPGRHDLKPARITEVLKRELIFYKIPKKVILVDGFPHNSMGKVRKGVLRERFRTIFAAAGKPRTAAGSA